VTSRESVLAALPPVGVRVLAVTVVDRCEMGDGPYDKRGVAWAELNMMKFEGLIWLDVEGDHAWVERRDDARR